jgi:DNA-binding transcriptional LysR family regulator
MEDELGGALVDRTGKRKGLTPLGELIVSRARRVVLEVSEMKRSAALLTDLALGTVRLAQRGTLDGCARASTFSRQEKLL